MPHPDSVLASSSGPPDSIPGPALLFGLFCLLLAAFCFCLAPNLSPRVNTAVRQMSEGALLLVAFCSLAVILGLCRRASSALAFCRAFCLLLGMGLALLMLLQPYYRPIAQAYPGELEAYAFAGALAAVLFAWHVYFSRSAAMRAHVRQPVPPAPSAPPGVTLLLVLCAACVAGNGAALLRGMRLATSMDGYADIAELALQTLPVLAAAVGTAALLWREKTHILLFHAVMGGWIALSFCLYLLSFVFPLSYFPVFAPRTLIACLALLWWFIAAVPENTVWFERGEPLPALFKHPALRPVAALAARVRSGALPVPLLVFLALCGAVCLVPAAWDIALLLRYNPPADALTPLAVWTATTTVTFCAVFLPLWMACLYAALRGKALTPPLCRVLALVLLLVPLFTLPHIGLTQMTVGETFALAAAALLHQQYGALGIAVGFLCYLSRSRAMRDAFPGRGDPRAPRRESAPPPLPVIVFSLFCLARLGSYGPNAVWAPFSFARLAGDGNLKSVMPLVPALIFAFAAWIVCPLACLLAMRPLWKAATLPDAEAARQAGIRGATATRNAVSAWLLCLLFLGLSLTLQNISLDRPVAFVLRAANTLVPQLPFLLAAFWYFSAFGRSIRKSDASALAQVSPRPKEGFTA